MLRNCGIDGAQADAILSTAKETDDGGYHCFSLGLCADAVHAERRSGREPEAESLRLRPQDWEALARRFLKSLASASECRWIERLAVTPRFDEHAARAASSPDWDALHDYSFVNPVPALPGRHAIRAQMRWALENQPSAKALVVEDHRWWREYWRSRSQSPLDDAASLAWRHRYHLESGAALEEWDGLAETARTDVPP